MSHLVPILILMLISTWIVIPLPGVRGAPLAQRTPDPRPTIVAPGTGSSPLPATPVDSEIALAFTVDKAQAHPGKELVYKAQISNRAGQIATNVWLTCDLPNEVQVLEITSTRGETQNYGQRISFEIGELQPSFDSQYATIVARIDADAAPGTELIAYASLTSDQAGGGERTVSTTLLGQQATASQTTAPAASPLPITGGGSIPLGLALAFLVIIVVVAVLNLRERANVDNNRALDG
jgi:uncharacterized repeat protein (TIGR01451 family)